MERLEPAVTLTKKCFALLELSTTCYLCSCLSVAVTSRSAMERQFPLLMTWAKQRPEIRCNTCWANSDQPPYIGM